MWSEEQGNEVILISRWSFSVLWVEDFGNVTIAETFCFVVFFLLFIYFYYFIFFYYLYISIFY